MILFRRVLACSAMVALTALGLAAYQSSPLTPDVQTALDHISPSSLRGHLSFIASDALEGRNTPSKGLDIAAEYIAAQFRRAGLEPIGDDGYFQTSKWSFAERDMRGFKLTVKAGKETITVPMAQVSFAFNQGLMVSNTAGIKIDAKEFGLPKIAGKVVLTELPDGRREQFQFMNRISSLYPALVISIDRRNPTGNQGGNGRLINPEQPATTAPSVPVITIHGTEWARLYDSLRVGSDAVTVTVRVPEPKEREITLRNVAGLLRGSDPILQNTYVLVTAHYDHVGMRNGIGDVIFNGANDDGSGTVSVIEIASALATLREHPKRSILFMTVFGEEKGLLGSRYYGRHPLVPIENTVADVNLEQMGRTDSTEGPQLDNASMTGFDFSDMGTIFQRAGMLTGIAVYKHQLNSDAYFRLSDNAALAEQGVPAHTLCVAFAYPDYHGLGDEWDKVDYANMARVDRMVALGVLMISDNPQEPEWNETNQNAAPYFEAWRLHHGK